MDVAPSNVRFILNRIDSFLSSNDVSQVFPPLTMSMEEILKNIVRDPNFLDQDIFADCSDLANKVKNILEINKDKFSLGYNCEIKKEKKKVMVLKKIPVQVFKEPVSVPLKPLRKPNVIQAMERKRGSIMSSVKISSLNATLKFVKNDSQVTLFYPMMSTEQALFVGQMIEECKQREGVVEGFKELYDPLVEAFQIFRLKFDFHLLCEEVGDMKQLKFVKTRKATHTEDKKSQEETDSDSRTSQKKLKKLPPLLKAMMETSLNFKRNVLIQLRNFLQDRTIACFTFENLTPMEFQFILHWQAVPQRQEAVRLFEVKDQMVLDEIRYCLVHKDYTVKLHSGKNDKKRWIRFVKQENAKKKLTNAQKVLEESTVPTTSTDNASGTSTSNSTDNSFSSTNSRNKLRRCKQKLKKTLSNIKDLKAKRAEAIKNIDNVDTPNTSFSSSTSSSKSRKVAVASHAKNNNKDIINTTEIQENWNKVRLNEIKTFLLTESQASLYIPSVTQSQKAFLKRVLIKHDDVIHTVSSALQTFPPALQTVVADIRTALSAAEDRVKVVLTFSKTKKGYCHASFIKEPVFSQKQKENIKHNIDKTENIVKNRPVNIKPIQKGNAEDIAKARSIQFAPVNFGTTNIINSENKPRPTLRTPNQLALIKLKTMVSRPRKETKIPLIMPAAKVKLIEGLNQPLVSEKGLKMMRQMGWDGGALGLRGEGITEPIMPQLDLTTRAGLGAPKPPPAKIVRPVMVNLPMDICTISLAFAPAKNELKLGILQTVLKMVIEHAEKRGKPTEINFKRELTEKNWSYMKYIVETFNNRNGVVADSLDVRELFQKIDERLPDEELALTACWGASKKNVLLLLSKYYEVIDIDRNDWCSVLNFDNTAHKRHPMRQLLSPRESVKVGSDVSVRSAVDSDVSVRSAVDSNARFMVDGKAFRYYVLSQILDFCIDPVMGEQPKTTTKDIHLKGAMTDKQRSYISDAVRRLNARAACSSAAPHERALHARIVAARPTLAVQFPTPVVSDATKPVYKIIRLHKESNTQPKVPVNTTKTVNNNHIEIINNNALKTNNIVDLKITNRGTPNDKVGIDINTTEKDNIKDCICCLDVLSIDDDLNIIEATEKTAEKTALDKNTKIASNDNIIDKTDVGVENSEKVNNPERNNITTFVDNIANKHQNDIDMINPDEVMSEIDNAPNINNNINPDIVEPQLNILQIRKSNIIVSDTKKDHECDASSLCKDKFVINNKKNSVSSHIVEKFDTSVVEKTVSVVEKTVSVVENTAYVVENTASVVEKAVFGDIESEKNRVLQEELEKELKLLKLTAETDTQRVQEQQTIEKENSGKRMRQNNDAAERHKRPKYDFLKHVNIATKYSKSMSLKLAAEVQKAIIKSIDKHDLPHLKCNGIQNGALSYSCHNESSLKLLTMTAKSLDLDITTIDEICENMTYKMSFKMNSFLDESVDTIFQRIEDFNISFSTKDWVFVKKEVYSDFLVIFVDIDTESFLYIRDNNYLLYAGVDAAQFSIVWN